MTANQLVQPHIGGVMKKVLLASIISSLLNACGTTQIIKPDPIQGSLKNATEVSMRFQNEPVRTGAVYNTTGYTIVGVLYVAAAVSKMNSQSDEMQAAYSKHLKDNPEIPSLQDTFNNELERALLSHGIKITKISAVKKIGEKKEISYDINPSEINTKQAVIIDGLTAQYFAPSSTDYYNPKSMLLISVLDVNNSSSKPAKQEQIVETKAGESGPFAYKNYEMLSKDPGQAYDGLQQSVARLAKKVAESLIGKDTITETAVESLKRTENDAQALSIAPG